MYKILIKSNATSKVFKFYQVEKEIVDEVTGLSAKVMVDYETEDLDEISNTYKELLKTYTTEQVVPMHNLEVELNTIITE